jgi:hypothetical protein
MLFLYHPVHHDANHIGGARFYGPPINPLIASHDNLQGT